MNKLFLADSLNKLKELPDNYFDAVVTDPPYGLSFMGKKWDYDVPSVELWREVLRVLKPGGHLLSFGGTRTYHRMVVNIENAGFEIRDQLQWLYGSGFPKSLDVSKAIDKAAGAKREVISSKHKTQSYGDGVNNVFGSGPDKGGIQQITAPATDAAKQWAGWGTALKPANEPIVLARKPLEGTVAQNVEKWGVGGLNIDGCRVGCRGVPESTSYHYGLKPTEQKEFVSGRWPANVILDEEAARLLDEQSGILKSGDLTGQPRTENKIYGSAAKTLGTPLFHKGDSGGASRFFYCAKASKSERDNGLESRNNHPTVKPIKLMEYLCKLITPVGGKVLDPFMGSGTTGVASINSGFQFVGIERESEYFEIAKNRILQSKNQLSEKDEN